MWIRRLKEKYGKKFDFGPPEEKDDPFREQSEKNTRRIYTRRFFDVDILDQKVVDLNLARRRGVALIVFSLCSICIVFYMWFHCYYASCKDCTLVVTARDIGSDGEVECHCANCITNYFFNTKTHFEKCYYSLLLFNSLVVIYIFSIVKTLAFQIFRHSNLAQRD
ncbi:hypothetical protein X943_001667 [Babesia divergens]|uniref:Uncharacterized protein n=1 Tax=Babesia divergens TaxID=32595 RepID=A0AAD9LGS2_BABDI|nr:hypothetical protein X943_001667 [Babesia divergens]